MANCIVYSTLAVFLNTCLSTCLEPSLNFTSWSVCIKLRDVEHAVTNSVSAKAVTLEALLVAAVELNTLVTCFTSRVVNTIRVGCLNLTKAKWVSQAALAASTGVLSRTHVTGHFAAEVCAGLSVVIV
jgi:hypothetical protein